VACPACGADASEEALFCSRCGTRLSTAGGEQERRVVTALFCDLVGSTSLGERMDPEEIDQVLARYYALASRAIDQHGGTVEKFIGDAVVALYGYPVAHEDDPARALATALEIVEQVGASGLGIEVRLGVNTGEAFVRADAAGEWNATGDVINTASRLQTAAPPMGAFVGERTRAAAAPLFEFAQLAPLELKGKKEPVVAWQLLGATTPTGDDTGVPILVGRRPELIRLSEAVAKLNGHGGQVLFVEGEAGIGKSRLVREARDSATGVTWLRGRSIETRDAGGYRPFAELIRVWSGSAAWTELAGHAEALGLPREDAGLLATIAGIEPDADLVERFAVLDAEAMRPSLYRSVLSWLDALSGSGPLVLEFEDWHWADGASIQLAGHVLPLTETRPLLLLMVARPGSTPIATISGLATAPRLEHLELTPLDAKEAALLLHGLVGGHAIAEDRVRSALARAEGNPYFLHELSRFLAENEGGALPDSVRAVITSRVDRLAPELKRLLRTAAAIGRTFPDELLARIELGEEVDARLGRLTASRLIEAVPPDRHRFLHALTREAVYESTPLSDRKRLHSGVAAVLSEDREANLPAIAYHLAQAEDWDAAASSLLDAGEQATRLAADAEALEMYEAAIDAYEHLPPERLSPLERSRIDRRVAAALTRLGRNDEARRRILIALARLGLDFPDETPAVRRAVLLHLPRRLLGPPPLPPPGSAVDPIEEEIARGLELLGWICFFSDHDRYALATFMLAGRAAKAGFVDGMAMGTFRASVAFSGLGNEKLARRYMQRALEAAELMTDQLEIARLKQGLGTVAIAIGDWDEARTWAELGLDLGTAVGDLRSQGSAGVFLAIESMLHGDYERGREFAAAIILGGEEGGERQIVGFGHAAASVISAVDPGAGVESALAAVANAELVPDYLVKVACLGTLARGQMRTGSLQAAAASIEEGLREAAARGLRGCFVGWLWEAEVELALLGLARDRNRATTSACKKAVRRALRRRKIARWYEVHAHTTHGALLWLLGKTRAADRAFARGEEFAARYDWPGSHAEACAWVARCFSEAGLEVPERLERYLGNTKAPS
jgi:class 3 adenylate cyclase/tetratricopeptide (TPR) repeat protein